MYVVRRAFRNFGEMVTPGSTVEPGNIKRFKFRLTNGYIVEVSEQDFDKWREYFKVRFGVELKLLMSEVPMNHGDTGATNAEDAKAAIIPNGSDEEAKPAEPVKVIKVVTPK